MGETIGAFEAVKVLGVSRMTLWRMVKAGEVPVASTTASGRSRFNRTALEQIRDGLAPATAA